MRPAPGRVLDLGSRAETEHTTTRGGVFGKNGRFCPADGCARASPGFAPGKQISWQGGGPRAQTRHDSMGCQGW